MLHLIRVEGQEGSVKMANFLCSGLVGHKVLTGEGLRSFDRRYPLEYHDLKLAHLFLRLKLSHFQFTAKKTSQKTQPN